MALLHLLQPNQVAQLLFSGPPSLRADDPIEGYTVWEEFEAYRNLANRNIREYFKCLDEINSNMHWNSAAPSQETLVRGRRRMKRQILYLKVCQDDAIADLRVMERLLDQCRMVVPSPGQSISPAATVWTAAWSLSLLVTPPTLLPWSGTAIAAGVMGLVYHPVAAFFHLRGHDHLKGRIQDLVQDFMDNTIMQRDRREAEIPRFEWKYAP